VLTHFRELADQLRKETLRARVILDGEVMAIDEDGRINFWDLMRGRGVLAVRGIRSTLVQWVTIQIRRRRYGIGA
jgi:ATP-dependent DNA ligase